MSKVEDEYRSASILKDRQTIDSTDFFVDVKGVDEDNYEFQRSHTSIEEDDMSSYFEETMQGYQLLAARKISAKTIV